MNLENYYWFFSKALPDSVCNDIIKYGNTKKEQLALTGRQNKKITDGEKLTEEDLKDLKKKRDSNIVWLDDRWIYNEIQPYIHIANKNAGWNFDWDWSESCQFTKYKLNQYYGWHCDSWSKIYSDPKDLNRHGKIRKLSVTVSLSSPEDYKGGELEFDTRENDPDKSQNIITCDQIKPRGSIVVFPSHIWHRVKPVTEGTRYSLVIWNLGLPFK
tara:strand:+ start:2685 stop:3326 length:642 start_codon:yes stop_codon:yes gene_type:complete